MTARKRGRPRLAEDGINCYVLLPRATRDAVESLVLAEAEASGSAPSLGAWIREAVEMRLAMTRGGLAITADRWGDLPDAD